MRLSSEVYRNVEKIQAYLGLENQARFSEFGSTCYRGVFHGVPSASFFDPDTEYSDSDSTKVTDEQAKSKWRREGRNCHA